MPMWLVIFFNCCTAEKRYADAECDADTPAIGTGATKDKSITATGNKIKT